ncbi:glutathione-regulated potassium-efflux system ancillary protein KefG [Flavobacterium gossypii]|uniref:Glutathione-regulated potassium-efflux system ancillary protein KefG n=1 Tax=Flavobacterium gossypii TaxID=1646119 RepID=A0ABR6DLF5_9FLAO|nr:NAD(P)H-dependent oxidoreductase [Flavobacterium gossypii]MBA9072171.1 glutathione-regulated potassium-efflux system ancillary protein KefG [Flavobacterium gossypii]
MSKNKILIVFAHPLFEKSFANKILAEHIPPSKNITFHDLYEIYPEFDINVKYEQELLKNHDIIIWQHPMYWYSCPPLLKQWIDMVLEYGWAYGKNGLALQDKIIFQAITTGANMENYSTEGDNLFTLPELLRPFSQTAKVCRMEYLPPFVIHGTHKMEEETYYEHGASYARLLNYLETNEIDAKKIQQFFYMNDWMQSKNI